MRQAVDDLRYGLRSLRRSPSFTAVATLTLALAIGANAAIWSVVHAVLMRPLPFTEPERLVVMHEWSRESTLPSIEVSFPGFLEWRRASRSFESMAVFSSNNWSFKMSVNGDAVSVPYAGVSAAFFDTLGARPLLGRTFRAEEDEPGAPLVAVLSHGSWMRRFGKDPNVIGREIPLDYGPPATIVGVMPREFEFPRGVELWAPANPLLTEIYKKNAIPPDVDLGVFYVVGRLRPGVSPDAAQAELDPIVRQRSRTKYGTNERTAKLLPFVDFFLGAKTRPALLALSASVALLLLVACANVSGLVLARAISKQKEIALRLALGAGRGRVVRHLAGETAWLALAGGLLGLLLLTPAVQFLAAFLAADIPRIETAAIDRGVLAVTFSAIVFSTVLIGLAPAFLLRRPDLIAWLKLGRGRDGSAGGRHGVRHALVVLQVALTIALVTGAGLLGSTLENLMRELGYEPENVLTLEVETPKERYTTSESRDFHRRLLEQVRRLPGVESAGAIYLRPLELGPIGQEAGILAEGQPSTKETFSRNPLANWEAVTPGYFRTMGIRLLAGRDFTERDDERAPSVVIIGESLARHFWPGESAIGKRLSTYGGRWEGEGRPVWQTIVGIVGDARYRELTASRLDVYLPYGQSPDAVKHLVVRARSDPLSLVDDVRAEVKALDKELPLDGITTMSRIVDRAAAPWRVSAWLLRLFALNAWVLAGIGVYGVVAFNVEQRRQEMGVRAALGARPLDLFKLVIQHSTSLVATGCVLGLLGALAVGRGIRSLLHGVGPADPTLLVGTVLLLVASAFLASYLPARRATRVDPLEALRAE